MNLEQIWQFLKVQQWCKKKFFSEKKLQHHLPATQTDLYVKHDKNRWITSVYTRFLM